MSSSKAPDSPASWGSGDRHDLGADAQGEESRSRGRLMLVWGLAIAVPFAVCAAGAWYLFGADPAPLLADARAQLHDVMFEPDADVVLGSAEEAEDLLRRYANRRGKEAAAANLLLAAAVTLQVRAGMQENMARMDELSVRENAIVPSACTTGDLAVAASAYARQGQLGKAETLIAEALTRDDCRADVLRLAADIRYRLGRHNDVLNHCRELAEVEPDEPFPYRMMGMIYEQRRDQSKLVEIDRKLIELAPGHADEIRRRLIVNLIALAQAREARAEFDRLKADAPGLLDELPELEAKLLFLEGRVDDASSIAEQILSQRSDDREALLLEGRIDLARMDVDKAIGRLRKLVEKDPSDNEAHYLLGQAYARAGNRELAEKHLALHHHMLGIKVQLYELQQDAANRPKDADVRRKIAGLYEELGWKEEAARWRQAAAQAGGPGG